MAEWECINTPLHIHKKITRRFNEPAGFCDIMFIKWHTLCTNALIEEYVNMVENGIVDPAKDSHRNIIQTRLKISIFGTFWLVVLERHKAFLRPPHQNLSKNTRFLGRRILRFSKIVIIKVKRNQFYRINKHSYIERSDFCILKSEFG